jgi:hypothetical protein
MERRLGLYPGTQGASNAEQRPTIDAWFGRQNGVVSVHEAGIFASAALRLLLGWKRPCVAYVDGEGG